MTSPAVFASCTRFLSGHGPRNPAKALRLALAQVGEDERADIYGTGPLIEEFERELAEHLGMHAAIFMPSGTMAQQIALRLHAGEDSTKVALHPTSHLELHEEGAARLLHGLDFQFLGEKDRLFTLEDLRALDELPASILWELPQREIGGQLPSWDELSEQLLWARSKGIACHLDGARLWEAAPFYRRSHAEIACQFDSVYVSFYKGLGGIAGAALLGSEAFINSSRPWLRRHGGNLISLYPYILSARAGMKRYLDAFAQYLERARSLAAALESIPGIRIVPSVPHAPMMHLHFEVPAASLMRANETIAGATQVMLFGRARETSDSTSVVEVSIGSACEALSNDELHELFSTLLDSARAG